MRKTWSIFIAALFLVLAGMACGIMEREVAIEDTNLPVSGLQDPSGGSGGGGVEIASIDLSRVWAPSTLRSYRAEYQMEVWFDGETESSSLSMTMTLEVTADPAAQHIITTQQGGMFPSEVSVIESEMFLMNGVAYMKSSLFEEWTAFEEDLVDVMSEMLLNPQDYVMLPEKAQRNTTPETINGILAWHFTYDENDVEDAMFDYEELNSEVWIAVEGGFIIKLENFAKGASMSGDLENNFFADVYKNATIRTTYNMTDINTDFTILLPEEAATAEITDLFGGFDFDSEWTREDVPFPEGAEVDYSFADNIALQTSSSVQDVKAFMLPQMQAYGWILDMEKLNDDERFLGDYIQGDDFLTLSIEPDIFDGDLTNIHVEIRRFVLWTREDIVFPQDAFIERSFEGELHLLSYLSVQDGTNFMISQLEVKGWMLDTEYLRTENTYMGTFTKGSETLTLTIDPALDEQGRTRFEIILE